MASADFPPPLSHGISPGQYRTCPFAPSGSTVTVDDSGASLVLACSPAALGLTASSCSYGRSFASALSELPGGLTPGFRFGCRHLPVGDLSPREVRHLPDTRARPSGRFRPHKFITQQKLADHLRAEAPDARAPLQPQQTGLCWDIVKCAARACCCNLGTNRHTRGNNNSSAHTKQSRP